ncbi:hypothetical protein FXO37_24492 [Capsicum annuum]|nr:hypothetical protein FXO37_24492 [Capsicum annuum]
MKSKRNRPPPALPPPPPSTASSESDYAFTLTNTAVAQICSSTGFTAAESPALRILTEIATRYLRSIAKSAAESANSANRTESNLTDTTSSVEALCSVTGFPGASEVTGSFLNSGAVTELAKFTEHSEEIPFAKPLPRKIFSIGSEKSGKVLGNVGSNSNSEYIGGERKKHIPKWLPAMPVIAKEEEKGREKGKEIWGFCGKAKEIEIEREQKGEENNDRGERKGIELALKREKVRFKIGSDGGSGGLLGGGVCRRGGIGKRVLCENWSFDDKNHHQNIGTK